MQVFLAGVSVPLFVFVGCFSCVNSVLPAIWIDIYKLLIKVQSLIITILLG